MMYFRNNALDGSSVPLTLIKPLEHIFLDIKHTDKMETVEAQVLGLINLSKMTRECESAMPKHIK